MPYFDVSYSVYSVYDRLKNAFDSEYFISNPLEISMKRFRNKLLWNVVQAKTFYHPFDSEKFETNFPVEHKTFQQSPYFVTLTIADEKTDKCDGWYYRWDPYNYLFKRNNASRVFSKYMTATRNYVKRHGFDFNYAWRIERGTKNTERLHFHVIIFSNMPLFSVTNDSLSKYFQKTWKYCDWGALPPESVEKCFEEGDSEKAALYASKYCSKSYLTDACVHIHKIKRECKGRLVGTSRSFCRIPNQFHPVYDPLLKKWEFHLKSHLLYIPPHLRKTATPGFTVLKHYTNCFNRIERNLKSVEDWEKRAKSYGSYFPECFDQTCKIRAIQVLYSTNLPDQIRNYEREQSIPTPPVWRVRKGYTTNIRADKPTAPLQKQILPPAPRIDKKAALARQKYHAWLEKMKLPRNKRNPKKSPQTTLTKLTQIVRRAILVRKTKKCSHTQDNKVTDIQF